MKVNLLDFDLQGLIAHSATMGERAFRAQQLMRWIHRAGESDFGNMTNLAKSFRAKLVDTAEVAPLPIISDTTAADGTRKPFVSGYSNDWLPNLWDRSREAA